MFKPVDCIEPMAAALRIVLIDAHPLYRDGVRLMLSSISGFTVVGEGGSGDDALHLAATASPDLILMDVRMPGDGIAATAALSEAYPRTNVILLTASESEGDVSAAMAAGARGYVLKGVSGRELVDIIRAVQAGESYVAPSLAATMLRRLRQPEAGGDAGAAEDHLTAREDQIITQVSKGLTNKEIARKLDISEKTVKHYMTLIMQKLNVRNRVEAVLKRQPR